MLKLCCRSIHLKTFIFSSPKRLCHRSLIDQKIIDYLSKYPDTYVQKDCEKFWSSIWEQHKLFVNKDAEPKFRLLLPPPNITGSLHLGHSLTVAIQDALCRYHRMNGETVQWYGGTDHAGIATQIIIEKILWAKFGKTRQDVSREEFSVIIEKWKKERIDEIECQLKSLGVSIDFQSNYFTLSPEMSSNVNQAFIELFNRGMIYRASYMVNWSYYLQSTLSDIEIEHKYISGPTEYKVPGCDEPFQLGVIHYFKYPLENIDSDEFVTIATTRLESIMGDVGLAVHPDDTRYSHLIGKFAFNPFTNEKMPIIAEESVKPDFGTGVLKLTPAHSSIDYEITLRHNLPSKTIFNDQGFIDCEYKPLNNVHRYSAKELVKQELVKRNLYCGFKDHGHWLPICSRSGDIIETRVVPQWFIKADDARYAAEFVANRDNLSELSKTLWEKMSRNLDEHSRNMAIIPSSYRNTWKDWFSRYKDWCISRQIYWGHQIPAYEIIIASKPTNIWIAAMNEEQALNVACEKHGFKREEVELRRDQDVLDTWFSSALLPLAVTGWFQSKSFRDLPLSLMETGHDIIFFWVARMTLISLMLSGRLPFDKVLLHGMICDEKGKKMSKSKANVVDPLHLIEGASFDQVLQQNKDYLDSGLITREKFTQVMNRLIKTSPKGIPVCGADILRLSLLQSRFKEQNIKFDLQKTIKKRVFANKMHQTVRFILLNLTDEFKEEPPTFNNALSKVDKWILSKLVDLINHCRFTFDSYDLHHSARQIEQFWTDHLCDVYLESIKRDIVDRTESYSKSMNVMLYVARQTIKLIHPFMPFITENLFQQLEYRLSPNYSYRSILESEYPNVQNDPVLNFDRSIDDDMEKIIKITKKIRWFKQNFHIPRDSVLERIRIASLYGNLSDFQSLIESSVKIDNLNREQLKSKLMEKFKNNQTNKCDLVMAEMDLFHFDNFTKNYKKLTKIIS
ncbi:valyl-tRNA synthetase 2, mitochondrial (putative)-like protein [Euroglyphus maynei]|uniref:valine--tRNA ligase n=1 Tax=Euroglyphus maynei TaxID=6958 RepID=A0A1Y3AWI1_EURMA|nr:valyl-tRNA synthetase 2, mitochondrial (putative)-like protein [Euroglyphus maynei]